MQAWKNNTIKDAFDFLCHTDISRWKPLQSKNVVEKYSYRCIEAGHLFMFDASNGLEEKSFLMIHEREHLKIRFLQPHQPIMIGSFQTPDGRSKMSTDRIMQKLASIFEPQRQTMLKYAIAFVQMKTMQIDHAFEHASIDVQNTAIDVYSHRGKGEKHHFVQSQECKMIEKILSETAHACMLGYIGLRPTLRVHKPQTAHESIKSYKMAEYFSQMAHKEQYPFNEPSISV